MASLCTSTGLGLRVFKVRPQTRVPKNDNAWLIVKRLSQALVQGLISTPARQEKRCWTGAACSGREGCSAHVTSQRFSRAVSIHEVLCIYRGVQARSPIGLCRGKEDLRKGSKALYQSQYDDGLTVGHSGSWARLGGSGVGWVGVASSQTMGHPS